MKVLHEKEISKNKTPVLSSWGAHDQVLVFGRIAGTPDGFSQGCTLRHWGDR